MDLYGFRPAERAAVRAGVLVLALVAALSFAAGHRASAAAQTDGSAPPTVIKDSSDLVHHTGQWQYLTSDLDGDLLLSAAREA